MFDFLISSDTSISSLICEGALLAAKEMDVNLFILPAGVIGATYDDVEANFNVPKEFEKENVTRDKVLKIIKFGRIHFYEDGGGCFLGECPIANPEGEVLGFEFTDGKIEITELY